jgi:hypothetical protein
MDPTLKLKMQILTNFKSNERYVRYIDIFVTDLY